MLVVELHIIQDTGLEEVVAEEGPLLQVLVHIQHARPERLHHQRPVLFASDLIPDSTNRVKRLQADRLDLGHNRA